MKISQFERNGIIVLSPSVSRPKGVRRGFVLLRHDVGSPRRIQERHLHSIVNSDFLYVVNPGGYLGPSASFEVGYSLASGVPVFCSETPSDHTLGLFVDAKKSVSEIKKRVSVLTLESPRGIRIKKLQAFVKRLTTEKGFGKETLEDKILLLTEEMGELARGARAISGLKVSRNYSQRKGMLPMELADVLIYIADIANITNLDLERALLWKLRADFRREWKRR